MKRGNFLKALFPILIAACFCVSPYAFGKIKIACVGDSITAGNGIKNQQMDAYPAVLGQMLGDKYEVRNFGGSGRTLLRKGDNPYWNDPSNFDRAREFLPDIVIIKLGTNDSKPQNWKYKDEFKGDLRDMIGEFQKLESKPQIILCTQMFVVKPAWGITNAVVRDEVMPATLAVAKEKKLKVIDFYNVFKDKPELIPDGVHPNDDGAMLMASIIYKSLTGKEAPKLERIRGKRGKAAGFDLIDIPYRNKTLTCVYPKTPGADRPWIWVLGDFKSLSPADKKALNDGIQLMFWSAPLYANENDAMNWANEFYFYGREKFGLGGKFAIAAPAGAAEFAKRFAEKYPDRMDVAGASE